MPETALPSLLSFAPVYFDRIWGGTRMRGEMALDVPADRRIGEAWLVSDHAECQSRVAGGHLAGATLGELVRTHGTALLGNGARPTHEGRFPLLLKLIDAGEALSVQVHPDDTAAARLGESDIGKTEMWHVLSSDPDAGLICGMREGVTPDLFRNAAVDGTVARLMRSCGAAAGTSLFVPAGTVHAIGKGILLAEIQQNSNITYRVFDWNRVDEQGRSRALHLEQAMDCISFDASNTGPAVPLGLDNREILCACRYFAAERRFSGKEQVWEKGRDSFHLVLAGEGPVLLSANGASLEIQRGGAALVPGYVSSYSLEGAHPVLVYYVPELARDLVGPLLAAGHDPMAILGLGGPMKTNDLASLLQG